jgi:hypothetical protein
MPPLNISGIDQMESSSREWPDRSAEAFAEIASGRMHDGARRLLDLESKVCDDTSVPLRAAVQNNAGLAHLLGGDSVQADAFFNRAALSWQDAVLKLRDADIAISGRSSSFHLVLAARHHAAFAEVRRRRLLEYLDAAIHITQLNASPVWRAHGGAASEFLSKVCRAFGPDCVEAMIVRNHFKGLRLNGAADLLQYGRKPDFIRGARLARLGSAADFCADVAEAAHMTGLIIPGLIGMHHNRRTGTAMTSAIVEQLRTTSS